MTCREWFLQSLIFYLNDSQHAATPHIPNSSSGSTAGEKLQGGAGRKAPGRRCCTSVKGQMISHGELAIAVSLLLLYAIEAELLEQLLGDGIDTH